MEKINKQDDTANLFSSECVVCNKRGVIKIRHGICLFCWNQHFTDIKL